MYLLASLLFNLAGSSLAGSNGEPDVIVDIEQGSIRGSAFTASRNNQNYFGFLGIPYAQPPIGPLRFMRAEPTSPWSGIRNATKEGNICPQIFAPGQYKGDEDCLFVNVYTPKLPHDALKVPMPVMVWIHGGLFIKGSGNREEYGPDYIVSEGVILVTFNYRLGVLGFLSLQNEIVPGNNGLKDQVLVLQWVRKNIHKFGGDPNKVTIFGESAGAASVHYHMLSPMSRGLFKYAISESGSALSPWAYQTQEESLNASFLLAESAGTTTTDANTTLKVLRSVEPKFFAEYSCTHFVGFGNKPASAPTVDNNGVPGDVFLPDIPINLINSGRADNIPYIIGMNSQEMGLFIQFVLDYAPWTSQLILERLPVPHPLSLAYLLELFFGVRLYFPMTWWMGTEVLQKYYDYSSGPIISRHINILTDLYFGNGIFCTAQKRSANSSVWVYEFSYKSNASFKTTYDAAAGAVHGDEIYYLFRRGNRTYQHGTADYLTSARMVKLWTNFAKTGNPTPEVDQLLQNLTWPPVSQSSFPTLNIDFSLSLKKELRNGTGQWWQQLLKKYGATGEAACWTSHGFNLPWILKDIIQDAIDFVLKFVCTVK